MEFGLSGSGSSPVMITNEINLLGFARVEDANKDLSSS